MSEYYTLIWYMICRYFLPYWLTFFIFIVSFDGQGFLFWFWWSLIYSFFSHACAFLCHIYEFIDKLKVKICPKSSSEIFIILAFIFVFYLFWVNFFIWYLVGVQLFFFPCMWIPSYFIINSTNRRLWFPPLTGLNSIDHECKGLWVDSQF